ncbi:hypothetical protein SAY87_026667 [Trapa incisa]|uniref:Uncharacterized protein n=1 Tax=Trapa incisa TaxID=236973 RepID=A0AAN7GRW7_9MYRT|nr:hypothetical protein SAY87_026667 [Trapa incisa]
MKFGKEFVSQMVPEWQDAYMDYSSLKNILKNVMDIRRKSRPSEFSQGPPTTTSDLKRKVSMYRAFSGLTGKKGTSNSSSTAEQGGDEEVILVNLVKEAESSESRYQTMFLMSSEEGGDCELAFFNRLDDEFNKVVRFYYKKVGEVVEEADELNRQMNALIALRIKVERPNLWLHQNPTGDPHFSHDHPTSHLLRNRNTGRAKMDSIPEVETNGEDRHEGVEISGNSRVFKPAPIEILDHVKINVPPETPISTVKGLLMIPSSELSFTKAELRKAEERMTIAFVEFYQKLRFLKSYCFMNQLAFSKIMKKYEKITSRSASKTILKMVDDSYLGSSDEVNMLMERVEATFIKHFSNGNRSEGMKILRPTAKRERHRITFLLGCCFGCSVALIVAIVVAIHARNIFKSPGRTRYMDNIFPLYSLYGFIVIHMIMFACNIYFWKRYRINYPFIFGFKQGVDLSYREVLLIASVISMLTLAGAISNLDMDMDPRTQNYKALTELVPLALLLIMVVIIFLPFNIIYRPSRFFFIQCTFHCICAPLYKVTLPDFFMADQFTSQVQALRNVQFYICYYGWGDFLKRSNKCIESNVYKIFFIVVAIIPYWFRFLQCLRRLVEEKDRLQGYCSLKNFSTIVAVLMRTIFELRRNVTLRVLAAATSGIATIANTYWDIVIDWGLLRRNSKNPWLREKLAVPNRGVYFIAMVLNMILRFAWMQSVLGFRETPNLHRTVIIAIFASLEIVRRGIWNFFRLENEHFNNVGKFRAFKSVPLPFQHDDDHRL